jgi:hypothetical protein
MVRECWRIPSLDYNPHKTVGPTEGATYLRCAQRRIKRVANALGTDQRQI